jgi:hypothetical protein
LQSLSSSGGAKSGALYQKFRRAPICFHLLLGLAQKREKQDAADEGGKRDAIG